MDVSDETKKQWEANFLQSGHVSKVPLANMVKLCSQCSKNGAEATKKGLRFLANP